MTSSIRECVQHLLSYRCFNWKTYLTILTICIKLPFKYFLVNLDIYSSIVAKRTNEKRNCWITNLFIRVRKFVLFQYTMSCTGNHDKAQTFLSFVSRLSHIRKANEDQLYNTNSQRMSNMISNVFTCFMLILLLKKRERLTYSRTLPEIKVELKCEHWNC